MGCRWQAMSNTQSVQVPFTKLKIKTCTFPTLLQAYFAVRFGNLSEAWVLRLCRLKAAPKLGTKHITSTQDKVCQAYSQKPLTEACKHTHKKRASRNKTDGTSATLSST